ncbi:MAG: hypothetical protein P1U68_15805 [Verrucomicrobiales bacterium]|nr:hypothetical protein [Verrucomicrobiales bacterium]
MRLSLIRFFLILVVALISGVACKTRNNAGTMMPPAEVPPSEYPVGADGQPLQPGAPGTPGGRFGYAGDSGAPVPPPPPATPGSHDVRDLEPTDSMTSAPPEAPAAPEPPKASGPPTSSEMQFANRVPGDPLVVTLPGSNSSLGPISVEKYDSAGNPTGEPLKRGTQVQIPDPNNPGKKIYFKVP